MPCNSSEQRSLELMVVTTAECCYRAFFLSFFLCVRCKTCFCLTSEAVYVYPELYRRWHSSYPCDTSAAQSRQKVGGNSMIPIQSCPHVLFVLVAVLQGIFGEWLGTTHVLLPCLLCKRKRQAGISTKLCADVHLSIFSTCGSCYYFTLMGSVMPSAFHTRLSVALRALLLCAMILRW